MHVFRAGHTSHRSSRRGLQGGGSVHGGRTASTRRKQRQFRLDLSEALNPELVFEASANHRSTYPSGPALDPVQPQMEMSRAQPGSTHGENNAGGHGTSRYHDNQSTIPTKTREHRPEVKTETPLTSPRPHQPACPSPTGTQSSTTHSVTQSTEEAKAEIASFDAIEEFEALERQTEGELNEDELWRQAMKEGDTEEEEDKQDIAHRTTMPQSRLLYLDSQESQHADTESTDFSSEDEEEVRTAPPSFLGLTIKKEHSLPAVDRDGACVILLPPPPTTTNKQQSLTHVHVNLRKILLSTLVNCRATMALLRVPSQRPVYVCVGGLPAASDNARRGG